MCSGKLIGNKYNSKFSILILQWIIDTFTYFTCNDFQTHAFILEQFNNEKFKSFLSSLYIIIIFLFSNFIIPIWVPNVKLHSFYIS